MTDWACENMTIVSEWRYDAPPTMAMSMRPSWSAAASPCTRACNDEAHAALNAMHGPLRPSVCEIIPAAQFAPKKRAAIRTATRVFAADLRDDVGDNRRLGRLAQFAEPFHLAEIFAVWATYVA